ncbi:MAG: response regulator, partial [Nitrospirales bacterium]
MATATEFSVTLVAIDDDPQNLELITSALTQKGLKILTSTDPESGLELVLCKRPQIVLLDLVMPNLSGVDLLERIVEADPGMDVILMTAHYSTESAVEAIQKGACNYLNKPLAIDKLRQQVRKLVAAARKRQRALQLDRELLETFCFEGIVGRSPLMLDVFALIRRVGP